MPKVEFHTESTERIKIQAELIAKTYGPNLSAIQAAKAAGVGKTHMYEDIKLGKLKISRTKEPPRRGKIIITALDLAKYIEGMRE